MSAGKLPRQQRQAPQPIIYEEDSNAGLDPKRVRAPEFDTCLEVVTTELADPNRALLRRVFFVAEDKSKYVSVGYYAARGYQPLAEFGGAKNCLGSSTFNSCKLWPKISRPCATLCLQTNIVRRRTETLK